VKIKEAIAMLEQYEEDWELVFPDFTMVVLPETGEQYLVQSDDVEGKIIEDTDGEKKIAFCSARSELAMQNKTIEFQMMN
jgi:hypothetical protein